MFKNEKTLYTDHNVRLGVVTEGLFGYNKEMNGGSHIAMITNNRLLFIPHDSNAKLKLKLAQGAIMLASLALGIRTSNKASKLMLANEEFDIYGTRSVSMRWLPIDEGLNGIENNFVMLTIFRRSNDEFINDFVSLPSTAFLIEFPDNQRSSKFLEMFRKARRSWSEYKIQD
jgi:hypothetical protein